MKETSKVCRIAFVGNQLPRKCGNATFTTDLPAAVVAAHPPSVGVEDPQVTSLCRKRGQSNGVEYLPLFCC